MDITLPKFAANKPYKIQNNSDEFIAVYQEDRAIFYIPIGCKVTIKAIPKKSLLNIFRKYKPVNEWIIEIMEQI